VRSAKSALAILRPDGGRSSRVEHVLAGLFGALACAWLLGAFHGVEVDVVGIKWRETMSLGRFMTEDHGFWATGHLAYTWRALLGVAMTQVFLFGGFVALRAIAQAARSRTRAVASVDSPAA
jgi:hypothetical protein